MEKKKKTRESASSNFTEGLAAVLKKAEQIDEDEKSTHSKATESKMVSALFKGPELQNMNNLMRFMMDNNLKPDMSRSIRACVRIAKNSPEFLEAVRDMMTEDRRTKESK